MTPKMMYVEWVDSAGTNGWCTPHEVEAAGEPMACSSVGFFVKETKTAIVLAQNRSEAKNTARPWGELMTIPKVAVITRKVLR